MTTLVCDLCETAKLLGWWGDSSVTHCRACHRTWRRTSREAHCTRCCSHFTGPTTFETHLTREGCQFPGEVRLRDGRLALAPDESDVWYDPWGRDRLRHAYGADSQESGG